MYLIAMRWRPINNTMANMTASAGVGGTGDDSIFSSRISSICVESGSKSGGQEAIPGVVFETIPAATRQA